MDGFLPKADENLMQWVLTDSKGFPYWHERSIYRLVPNYPLLDLLAERDSDKNRSDIYIAEISDTQSIEFMRGLSRYNLIDEMVVYTLSKDRLCRICVLSVLLKHFASPKARIGRHGRRRKTACCDSPDNWVCLQYTGRHGFVKFRL